MGGGIHFLLCILLTFKNRIRRVKALAFKKKKQNRKMPRYTRGECNADSKIEIS